MISMCGMSAAFSAVFSEIPWLATFSGGQSSGSYAALLPCVISSLVAAKFAAGIGIHPESFHVYGIRELTAFTGLKMLLVAGIGLRTCQHSVLCNPEGHRRFL